MPFAMTSKFSELPKREQQTEKSRQIFFPATFSLTVNFSDIDNRARKINHLANSL
jgi:hypothetical protein